MVTLFHGQQNRTTVVVILPIQQPRRCMQQFLIRPSYHANLTTNEVVKRSEQYGWPKFVRLSQLDDVISHVVIINVLDMTFQIISYLNDLGFEHKGVYVLERVLN